MMQVCKSGCHIWILCVACDAGTLRQRQQSQPGKYSRCITYKHETRGGISSLLHWGGEDSFQECPSALATLSQSPWISKASLCLDRNLKVPSYLRHLRHWSSEFLRRWQCFIHIYIYIYTYILYIYQFPFNLQPPKPNGWTLKIAFGKFQPLVFRGGGVECIHQCSLDSLKIWNRGFWSCKGLAFTQGGGGKIMGLKEMPLDIFQVPSNGCCWK